MKEKIDETNVKNSKIKEKLREKTEEFINQSRLDILFVIDSTTMFIKKISQKMLIFFSKNPN